MSDSSELLGPGTWVQHGPATLVIRDAGWVVLVPGTRKEVIEAAWTVLGTSPSGQEFLDRLLEAAEIDGVDKLAALLFAITDGTSVTFGVKGKTPIAVYTGEGSQQIAGTEEEPFVLRTVEGVHRIAFGDLPPEESLGAPRIETGITRVRGFVHMSVDPAELGDEERQALAKQVEDDGRSIEDPEAKASRAAKPPPPAPKPATPAAPIRKPSIAQRRPGEMPPATSRGGSAPRSSGSAATAPAADAGPSVFDDLFAEEKPAPATPPAPAPPAAPAPAPAPAPTAPPAPTPEPAPASEPAGATTEAAPAATTEAAPADGPADALPRTPSASAPEAAPSDGSEPPAQPARARRRLVSSSLFDRRRDSSSTPSADPRSSAEASPPPEQESSPRAPSPAAPSDASPAVPSGRDPALPSTSVPTPEPAQDEVSPDTLVEPIDDEVSPDTLVEPIDDEVSPETLIAPRDDGKGPEQPAEHPAAPLEIPVPGSGSALATGGDAESTGTYDDLFGQTVFRRIEDAAVRRTEDDEGRHDPAEPPAESPDESEAAPPADEPHPAGPATGSSVQAPSVSSTEASAAIGDDFIDWVPGVGRTAPEIAHTAARRAAAPQEPGPAYPQVHMAERPPAPRPGPAPAPASPSISPNPGAAAGPAPLQTGPASQSEPPRERHAGAPHPVPAGPPPPTPAASTPTPGHGPPPASPAAPPGAGPARQTTGPAPQTNRPVRGPGQAGSGVVTLPGLVCTDGHANSPERAECRVCRRPLQGGTRTVARPPLGTVLISTGASFVLDRTAIVGRRPRASRVSGHDVPQLITVPSPQQDISRSHLELRLEGWHVVALDMGTTNGTTLLRPGMEPVRLRTREGVVLTVGDQIDLGDGIQLLLKEAV